MSYTVVRAETSSENLTGSNPYLIAADTKQGAYLLERKSDQKLFLLIGATAPEYLARRWADDWLAENPDY